MRLVPIALAAAALPLLAACSPAASGTSHPGISTSSSSAAAPANPNAGLLTGAQLKALLAPASFFPRGFTLDPTGSVDTGSGFQQPSPPPTGTPGCAKLDGTAWVGMVGPSSVSFAQDDYLDQASSQEQAQEIDVYPGTGAEQVMANLRKLAAACPSFRDAQTSSTATVRLQPGPSLGSDAITFLLSDPRWAGGTALEAIRVGTAVITVLASVNGGTGLPQATGLATRITQSLSAKITG